MKELDLRLRPPRNPRARLDGLVFMPRTIDKIRATFTSGNLGPYHVFPGLSQMLLEIIGADLAALRDAVSAADCDDDVCRWLRTHADTSRYEQANVLLTAFRHADIEPEHRAHFESQYPEYLIARYAFVFDLIEADDAEIYPGSHRW